MQPVVTDPITIGCITRLLAVCEPIRYCEDAEEENVIRFCDDICRVDNVVGTRYCEDNMRVSDEIVMAVMLFSISILV